MIVIFSDFGLQGPYLGQMTARIIEYAPKVSVVSLFADAPSYDIQSAAYLLAAYSKGFKPGSVFLCVVDPGVGDKNRVPVVLKTKQHWFVGPENGLFNVIAANQGSCAYWEIAWRPDQISQSFHGRDLFAPVAAAIAAKNEYTPMLQSRSVPDDFAGTVLDIAQIIYIDHYGNLITGIRSGQVDKSQTIKYKTFRLSYAQTFSSVEQGSGFWYENSSGLIEIAINQGKAKNEYNANVGDMIEIIPA